MARRDGQIIARGERKWLVRWHVGRDPSTGTYKYKSETIHGTKRDAQRKLNSVLRSRDVGTYVEPTRTTLNAYLDKWLATVKHAVRTRTYEDYKWALAQYVRKDLGDCRLDRLHVKDVQAMIDGLVERGLAPKTVRMPYRVLLLALKRAVEWEMLYKNPAAKVTLPKLADKEMLALSAPEVAAFRAEAAGTRYEVIFDLALATGMRPSEYLALTWNDVDLAAGSVSVRRSLARTKAGWEFNEPKTKRSLRTVPIPSPVVRSLKLHKQRQAEHMLKVGADYNRGRNLVFPNEVGEPMWSRGRLRSDFKAIAAKAGLPTELRLYDLRHTVATLLLSSGVNVKVVSERLGHASAAMTLDVYGHVLTGMQEEATVILGDVLFPGA